MSATTVCGELSVGIADPIKHNPALLEAVKNANEYLKGLLNAPNMAVDGREIIWGCSTNSPHFLSVNLSEWDRYGRRQALLYEPAARIIDPVSREYLMNNLISQILREQFFQIGSVIDRGIAELEREEELNGHAH